MNPDAVRTYLATQRRIIVVTIGQDGMPHPVPMNYGLDDEDRILITTFRKSQKVRNLERDPRATLLVESGSAYREFKAVIAWCDAEIIEDPALVPVLMRMVRADDAAAASLSEAMNAQVRATIAKRVIVRFTPFRYASWDHSKLAGFY
jgi:PPOX class probable F420-dependent enzyme